MRTCLSVELLCLTHNPWLQDVMLGVGTVRYSYSSSFMCSECVLWCSYSPSFSCWWLIRQQWFSFEASEARHGWSAGTKSPHELELSTEQTWCEECERNVCCVWRSAQDRKEEAAHRVEQETMDNELMNLEKKGREQSTEKGSEDKLKQTHQSTVTLCEVPPMEKPAGQLESCEVGDMTAALEGAHALGRNRMTGRDIQTREMIKWERWARATRERTCHRHGTHKWSGSSRNLADAV